MSEDRPRPVTDDEVFIHAREWTDFEFRMAERIRLDRDVVRCADALMDVTAEFPKDPSAWGEHLDALDTAIDKRKQALQ